VIRPPVAIVYGAPLAALAQIAEGSAQVSPLIPGAARLEDLAPGSLDEATIAAPPGTIERRYVLALALRALKPAARLTTMAPKEKGGARLGKELQAFGCEVTETGRRHQRLCESVRPDRLIGVEEAINAGAPRLVEALGLWSQPGLFSWEKPDPGTRLLLNVLEGAVLSGPGADLGCGAGLIARAILSASKVTRLDLVDIDRRAVEAARRNFEADPRVHLHWADARNDLPLEGLNFVVMNPPFHDGGSEDKALGQAFIRRARAVLKKGGLALVVANRHLPYEAALTEAFAKVALKAEGAGFKVYEARA